MKTRKLSFLTASVLAFLLSAVGFSTLSAQDFGDEEETKTHKIMEKVQVEHATVLKGVRNPASFRKSKEKVANSSKELVKLFKEARAETDAAKAAKDLKDAQKQWTDLMDACIKDVETFGTLVAKPDADQKDAKDAYKAVTKRCADCHDVFRVEE
jgi:cytochrome c556